LRDFFAHGTPLSLHGLKFTDVERCTEQSESIGDSTAAVVMVSIFDHLGGEERAVGDLGAGGASVSASPKSHFGGLTRDNMRPKFSRVMRRFF
jgi:hypothetical protein